MSTPRNKAAHAEPWKPTTCVSRVNSRTGPADNPKRYPACISLYIRHLSLSNSNPKSAPNGILVLLKSPCRYF